MQIPRNRRHGTSHRATWGSTRLIQETGLQGKVEAKVLNVVSLGRNGQDKVRSLRIGEFEKFQQTLGCGGCHGPDSWYIFPIARSDSN